MRKKHTTATDDLVSEVSNVTGWDRYERIQAQLQLVKLSGMLKDTESALLKEREEAETRQTALNSDIAAKEKELLEKIMKSGVSYGDAKAIIQKQIDGALNGFKGGTHPLSELKVVFKNILGARIKPKGTKADSTMIKECTSEGEVVQGGYTCL